MPSLPSPAQPATITIAPLEVRSASLAEQAYASLRTLILDRKISAGSPLQEGRLADDLRISRTPMREALVRLAGEGLLVRRDARSYAVRALGTKEYFDCMRAREIIECEAIVLAVDKITEAQLDELDADLKTLDAGVHDEIEHWHFDDRFHQLISSASGNVVLPRLVEELRVNARLFRLHSPLHRQRENHEEHGEIISALRARDPERARAAMRAHLRSLQEDVKRALVD
ncbi:DNA-binding GntR family transcriptional regulator [Variovorax paradoxus]|uniref:GntR family transcriptional regulator n=1 Tax=Variovorax paradoxus TaxID=34073 RepID=UPI0027881760|nr:GntR family transcriptional regulator [Variovorax paradoxus]MDP9931994.1 DNA-binding GntR family transcriptional regulator [Variovorax paradoxus]MDQ0026691.1 DNA-binding GntR family transcriptional regulator [Variovorax paradoxus]